MKNRDEIRKELEELAGHIAQAGIGVAPLVIVCRKVGAPPVLGEPRDAHDRVSGVYDHGRTIVFKDENERLELLARVLEKYPGENAPLVLTLHNARA